MNQNFVPYVVTKSGDMVMSFQGQQAKPEVEQPHILVKDFMSTKITTFRWNQTLGDVIQIMLEKDVSGGPVVDDNHNLVGIVSEGDCLKQLVKGKYFNNPSLNVSISEFMDTDVKTVSQNVNILDAAQMFLRLRLRRFPVVEDGKLLGQISQKDIIKAVNNLKDTTW